MKKIISVLLIFVSVISYSQIEVIKKYDEFEKTAEIEIKNIIVYEIKNDNLQLDLSKFCIYSENSKNVVCSNYRINIKNKKKEISFIEPITSYVNFLFEDKTTLKINYDGPFLLEAFDLSFNMSEEEFNEMSSKKIAKIRVYTEKNNDYEIKTESALKLKEAIQELLNAK
jgi:hypothetical protein